MNCCAFTSVEGIYEVASAAAAFAVWGESFTTEPAPHDAALTVVDVDEDSVTVPTAFVRPCAS